MMKQLLIVFLLISNTCAAQVNNILSADAKNFYTKAMPLVKPGVKNMVENMGMHFSNHTINVDSLLEQLKHKKELARFTPHELKGIIVLIMVQASDNADMRIKQLVTHTASDNGENNTAAQTDLIIQNKSQIAANANLVMNNIAINKEEILRSFK
ncbi:MAG: hypothetical protein JSS98_05890 [Bacteroidetes bacterium]|nr:hypothetical protein [Bacteroidota bacterium]